jgi:xeroderma pigmentosum group C-complementing protein
VKEGTQPLKFNKVRAGTVNRMRELEILKDGLREAGSGTTPTEGEVMQGLYARSQTEPYVPDPVVDVRDLHLLFSANDLLFMADGLLYLG